MTKIFTAHTPTLEQVAPGCRGAIAVYAASSSNIAPEYFEAARHLGALIAGAGYALVNGGGAVGLMGAVNDGCLAAGGTAVGVIPQFMHDKGWGHRSLSALVVARDMHHRKATMAALAADGVIALPGGVGTFEEILEIITWRKLDIYKGTAVIANINGYYAPLIEMLQKSSREGFSAPQPQSALYAVANTTEYAVELIADNRQHYK